MKPDTVPNTLPPHDILFVWHMHQPPYALDDQMPALPWTRLHATKAYTDMAWLLERFPGVRAVINFSGTLIEQLHHLACGQQDPWERLTARDPQHLSTEDRAAILAHFFSLDWQRWVEPLPRYRQLRDLRDSDPHAFTPQDLLDLQVLFNIAWFGFAARALYPWLEDLSHQNHFTPEDKARVLAAQRELAAQVLPRYQRLAARGQIEITVSPHNHPILPLLCDSHIAAIHPTSAELPQRFAFPEDALAQCRLAREAAHTHLQHCPLGMWPSEGALSEQSLAIMAEAGLQWSAGDEQILRRSLGTAFTRPAAVYRPWRYLTPHGPLTLYFRDTQISDKIGFYYRDLAPQDAVNDLFQSIDQAASDARSAGIKHPTITLILDGENPWERYPDDAFPFLNALYHRLEAEPQRRTILPASDPPCDPETLTALSPGSWIHGDFRIWIGEATKNTAWERLRSTRHAVDEALRAQGPRSAIARAVFRAQASDWFWWYGPNFANNEEALFDATFRAHLRAALHAAGRDDPALDEPIALFSATVPSQQQPPTALLPATAEAGGLEEHRGAATFCAPQGAMALHRALPVLRWGRTLSHLILQLDWAYPPPASHWRIELSCAAATERCLIYRLEGRGQRLENTSLAQCEHSQTTPDLLSWNPAPLEAVCCRVDTDQRWILRCPLAHDFLGEIAAFSLQWIPEDLPTERLPPVGTLEIPPLHALEH